MIGHILDLLGWIAISSRTFSISSGNQSGLDLSFLWNRDYIKYIKAAVWSRFQPFLRICPYLALTLISLFLSMALSPPQHALPFLLRFSISLSLFLSPFPSLFPHVITFLHVFEGAVEQKLWVPVYYGFARLLSARIKHAKDRPDGRSNANVKASSKAAERRSVNPVVSWGDHRSYRSLSSVGSRCTNDGTISEISSSTMFDMNEHNLLIYVIFDIHCN